MNNAEQPEQDEIDLTELLFRLWAFKGLIICLTVIAIGIGTVYFLKSEKVFSSSTTFFIPDSSSIDIQSRISSSLGALSGLVGIPTQQSSTSQLIERIKGATFILDLDSDLDFRNDKYFNKYNENYSDPAWKSLIKSLIGWKSRSIDPSRIEEWNILNSFDKNVEITETETGAISVSVNHSDAQRAAKIANHIAAKVILLVKSETVDESNAKLTYLSQKLADSLIKYENAEKNLKNFTLSNSSASLSSFATGSIILDDLRLQRDKSKTHLDTIDILLPIAKRVAPTVQDYLSLRKNYPILDQSDFRRILGISEGLSAWSWPSAEKLFRVRESIKDRVGSLEAEIIKLESDAKRYAQSAEEMERLTRNLKIEQATYSVLIEQVKSLSLAAGFTPDRSKIISTAKIAISPSEPKRDLILAVATVSGFFLSSFLALVLSYRTGCLYSERSLLSSIKPSFSLKIQSFRGTRSETLKAAQNSLKKRPISWPRQILLERTTGEGTPFTLVIDTTTSQYASTLSRLLGVSASELGLKAAYIDLSKSIQSDTSKQYEIVSEAKDNLMIVETVNNCTEYNYIGGKQNVEMFLSKSFQATLNNLKKNYDLVLLSADHNILNYLYSLNFYNNFKLIMHVSKGKTKSGTIDILNKKGNVDFALLT